MTTAFPGRRYWAWGALLAVPAGLFAGASGCSSDESGGDGGGGGGEQCPAPDATFEVGDPTGHADPYGAKAAGQARAGRITSEAMIVQPAHGRQQIAVGDFVLVNDKIAVAIEDKGLSDGYARFGGEILAVDKVGDDGRPMGVSRYVETLWPMSIEMVNPTSVSVINDGADGEAAVVRATGPLEAIPFLDGALGALFPRRYGHQAAYDFVLEPGSEKLTIRFGIINPSEDPVEFAFGEVSDEMHGFFHYNYGQLVTSSNGFGKPSGQLDWAGFVPREAHDLGPERWSFGWRPAGETFEFGVEISGFQYFLGPGFVVPGCSTHWEDHIDVIGGGPDLDGLREAIRRVDGADPWRAITGTVSDADGAPMPGAYVQVYGSDGSYLSRAKADDSGAFTVHAPPGEAATLVPYQKGYPLSTGSEVAAGESSATLTLGATGFIHVNASEATSGVALPVRVQIIPTGGNDAIPEEYGVIREGRGRLHREFVMDGDITLPVPPGDHQVVVGRGYEYEMVDQVVTVAAGQTVDVDAVLEHSVDTTGYLCADFHIHSSNSADSDDPIRHKVEGALADGLDIPVSSEHEWVVDFQPVIEELGLTQWAFGMPSEELTTFSWGHFGVVPLLPRPGELNNGAVEWIGKLPPAMFDTVQSLPEDPVFIINHPSGGGFGAYFSTARFDEATGEGRDAELWSTNFDAIEVFNASDLEGGRDGPVADWFSLLNHGHTFWATGSSDSHHLVSEPVGYPRTCMYFGHDDPSLLTANQVRDALGSGYSTISGGLFMTVEGAGGEHPGDTVASPGASVDFTVTVQSPSWVGGTTLEVIVNGESQAFEPLEPLGAGTANRWVNQVTVTLDPNVARNWVVFHAKGDGDLAPLHPGRQSFAVSNPVFFTN